MNEEFFSVIREIEEKPDEEGAIDRMNEIMENPATLGIFLENLSSQNESLYPFSLTLAKINRICFSIASSNPEEYVGYISAMISAYYTLPNFYPELPDSIYFLCLATKDSDYEFINAFIANSQSDDIGMVIRAIHSLKYVSLIARRPEVPAELKELFKGSVFSLVLNFVSELHPDDETYVISIAILYKELSKISGYFNEIDTRLVEGTFVFFDALSEMEEDLTEQQSKMYKSFIKLYMSLHKKEILEEMDPIHEVLIRNGSTILSKFSDRLLFYYMKYLIKFMNTILESGNAELLFAACVSGASMAPVIGEMEENPPRFYDYGYQSLEFSTYTCRDLSANLIVEMFSRDPNATLEFIFKEITEETLFLLYTVMQKCEFDFSEVVKSSFESILAIETTDTVFNITRCMFLATCFKYIGDEERAPILEKAFEFIASDAFTTYCLGCDMVSLAAPYVLIPSEAFQAIINAESYAVCKNGMLAIGKGCSMKQETVSEVLEVYVHQLLEKICVEENSEELSKYNDCLRGIIQLGQICELSDILTALKESFSNTIIMNDEILITFQELMESEYEPKSEILMCLAQTLAENDTEMDENYCINTTSQMIIYFIDNYPEEFAACYEGCCEVFNFTEEFSARLFNKNSLIVLKKLVNVGLLSMEQLVVNLERFVVENNLFPK